MIHSLTHSPNTHELGTLYLKALRMEWQENQQPSGITDEKTERKKKGEIYFPVKNLQKKKKKVEDLGKKKNEVKKNMLNLCQNQKQLS